MPTTSAFRYMTRFRCIGPQCEATCCAGWPIPLDRAHYERTEQAMRETPATRREFRENVQVVEDATRAGGRHALMVMNDGVCSFLTPGRLCSLQQRYGEDVLGDTCAQYPRMLARSSAGWELSGTASCPEVARQLLLHADALELDAVPLEQLGRRSPPQAREGPTSAPPRHHDAVREMVFELLSDLRFDLGTRLAMVACFADRARSMDRNLAHEIALLRDADARADLAHELARLALPATVPVRLTLAFMVRRAEPPLFDTLRATVLRTYVPALEGDEVADADLAQVEVEIHDRHRERAARFAELAPRVDRSLTNLAKSVWTRPWHRTAPDLLAHHMELMVLLTVVRLLVVAHPLLAEAEGASEAAREALVDRAVVDAVCRFSRSFEHSATGLAQLRETLQTMQLVTLPHALGLALFARPPTCDPRQQ
ncbi:MAG: flagellin lysine-N-methylase [Polyangiales bacterium]